MFESKVYASPKVCAPRVRFDDVSAKQNERVRAGPMANVYLTDGQGTTQHGTTPSGMTSAEYAGAERDEIYLHFR